MDRRLKRTPLRLLLLSSRALQSKHLFDSLPTDITVCLLRLQALVEISCLVLCQYLLLVMEIVERRHLHMIRL